MQALRRGAAAVVTAVALAMGGGTAAQASSPVQALTPWDAQLYSAAFTAARQGDYAQAAEKVAAAGDKSLAGHVEMLRLTAPNRQPSYNELTAWLNSYHDLPGADRVYALARRAQPAGAPEPRAPLMVSQPRSYLSLQRSASDGGQGGYKPTSEARQAREAYYSGDPRTAHVLAAQAGDRWIAGLSAFRLGNYAVALRQFESLARDIDEGTWIRSGAAYWASRAAIAGGSPELAPDFLRIAARTPNTFYGQIAERQLGLQSEISGQDNGGIGREIAELSDTIRRVAGIDQIALAGFIRNDPRAKRAVALAQLDMDAEAGAEMRVGLLSSKTDDERRQWTTLALSVGAPVAGGENIRTVKGVSERDFPTPRLTPRGGFSLGKALVYAIVKQESRFNPNATSHAGARGLMQLMPRTAAYVAKNTGADLGSLADPGTNLRLGQDYFRYLTDNLSPQGDLLRAVAAYNGGPGAVNRAVQTVGNDYDPLMVIESLPAAETRDYVEKVVAGYWIYRRIFGEDPKTLDAVASGARSADLKLDR